MLKNLTATAIVVAALLGVGAGVALADQTDGRGGSAQSVIDGRGGSAQGLCTPRCAVDY